MSDSIVQPAIVTLNYPLLDQTHAHLAEYAGNLSSASEEEFPGGFLFLLEMLEAHFAEEEQLMEQCNFRHMAEHKEDHRVLLQEVRQLLLRRQPFARAYVRERLPERLNLHISRMDSMLASALNQ